MESCQCTSLNKTKQNKKNQFCFLAVQKKEFWKCVKDRSCKVLYRLKNSRRQLIVSFSVTHIGWHSDTLNCRLSAAGRSPTPGFTAWQEGVQQLASIRAHNKSHVLFLLTARVPRSAQPWGCYKVERVNLRSACVQLLRSTQHRLLYHSWLPRQNSSEVLEPASKKWKILDVSEALALIPATSYWVRASQEKDDASCQCMALLITVYHKVPQEL